MIFSGVDLSIVSLSSGSLPLLAGVALTLMWWLDDELADDPTPSDPTPPSPTSPTSPNR